MEIKVNDIYHFSFNEQYLKDHSQAYWCFDGQFYVWKNEQNGQLYLVDTYWNALGSYPSGDVGKRFLLTEALAKGTLKFICNLDDLVECSERDTLYYDDNDVFNLSRQHGYYNAFYRRKDAERSMEKVKQVLLEDIEYIQNKIASWEGDLKWREHDLARLENGETNIYVSGYRRIFDK